MTRIIIAGGGIIGLCTAIRLINAGFTVAIVDKSCGGNGASYGNAGHIATEQTEPLASWAAIRSFPKRWFMAGGALSLPPEAIAQWLPFSLRLMRAASGAGFENGKRALAAIMQNAMAQWRDLLAAIDRLQLLSDDGHYIVWESEASARAGLMGWQSKDIGNTSLQPIPEDILAQITALTNIKLYGGVKFSGTGHIRSNGELLEGLISYLRANGAQFIPHNITQIAECAVRLDNGEVINGDKIIISAGFWSKSLLEAVGHNVPMIAERGYHVESSWGQATGKWHKDMIPVVFEDRSMIVTAFNQGLRAASFVEFSAPHNKPDPRKWQRLRDKSHAVGIYHDNDSREWIGVRPTLPDYLPAIGKSDKIEGLYYAFGHQHLGLTLAAENARIVKDMICDNIMPDKSFSLQRFE